MSRAPARHLHRLVAALVLASALPVLAGTASADTIALPQSLSAVALAPSATELVIPDGVRPTAIKGTVMMDSAEGGDITVLINGAARLSFPARVRTRVAVPVSAADLDLDRTIVVGLRYDPPGSAVRCHSIDPVLVKFDDLVLDYDGVEAAPRTVASFFPAVSPRIDVLIAGEASAALIGAGLQAVAALSNRYAAPTEVELVTGVVAPTKASSAGRRVVQLVEGQGPATTDLTSTAGVPTLVITGDAAALIKAARALVGKELKLANDAKVTDLAATYAGPADGTPVTLDDLGIPPIRLSGYGRSTRFVGIKQDVFGGPVSNLRVQLVGTHTAVPTGARAQLDVYLNGFLIDSQILSAEPKLSVDVEVESSLLKTDNGLEVALSAVPRGGGCYRSNQQLPLEVDIDPLRSTISGRSGTGRSTGFALFPQILGGSLPVAIRGEGVERAMWAKNAGRIVTSLQRAASEPLTLSMVEPEDLLSDDVSGLLVGASYEDSVAIDAPLRLASMRLLDYAEKDFQVGTGRAFGALEAIDDNGRQLLLLGAWTPDSPSTALKLADKVATGAETLGWTSLTEDLLLADESQPPFTLSTNAVVPQLDRVDERRSSAKYLVGGVLLLILILGLRTLVTKRRDRRISTIVDAQEAAEKAPPASTD